MDKMVLSCTALALLVSFYFAFFAAKNPLSSFMLSSPAFEQGQPIPVRYSCKGADISPALAWQNAPKKTQSFALIMDDPDAPKGVWVHWIVYNLPATVTGLPEQANIPSFDGVVGMNSWPKVAYGGPCPSSGKHRYVFKLYALDKMFDLPAGATKEQLLQAMKGHILAQTELMGTFEK